MTTPLEIVDAADTAAQPEAVLRGVGAVVVLLLLVAILAPLSCSCWVICPTSSIQELVDPTLGKPHGAFGGTN